MEITTIQEEKEEKGIFFRSPIQLREFDEYGGDCYAFFEKLKKNFILRLINKHIYKNFEKWSEGIDFAGCSGNVFTSPIYFSRNIRKARHILTDHPSIKEIYVFGEEPYKNQCSGSCIEEKAVIHFKEGLKKEVIKTKDRFNYYYTHIIKTNFNEDN